MNQPRALFQAQQVIPHSHRFPLALLFFVFRFFHMALSAYILHHLPRYFTYRYRFYSCRYYCSDIFGFMTMTLFGGKKNTDRTFPLILLSVALKCKGVVNISTNNHHSPHSTMQTPWFFFPGGGSPQLHVP